MTTKKALISVSDKTGITEFAKGLTEAGFEIISTGGTSAVLQSTGLPVRDIAQITGYPEMMDGRVKTLHPLIHAGILCRRSNLKDIEEAASHSVPLIDIICVNLYPFEAVAAKEGEIDELIENIDIGGPTLIRAAAKNHHFTTVITSPADYPLIIKELKEKGEVPPETRKNLALKAFALTAHYDNAINRVLKERLSGERGLNISADGGKNLRYGENPHQQAEIYRISFPPVSSPSLYDAEILNGKEMSYNNYLDAESALAAVSGISGALPAVAVVKHNNPCGFAAADTIEQALERAWEGDPVSAFGSIIALNRPFTLAAAEFLKSDKITHLSYQSVNGEYIPQPAPAGKFTEIIIAPDFEPDALEMMRQKSKTIRLLRMPIQSPVPAKTFRFITGALLVQDKDILTAPQTEVKTKKQFPSDPARAAEFGMAVCRQMISNAVCIIREYAPGRFELTGMGAGQPNRIDAVRKLAVPAMREYLKREYRRLNISASPDTWLKEQTGRMILISDAFFPFDDNVREAAAMGIRYIIQPGGSARDADSIAACDELGVAMAFTGVRHFRH